MSVPRRTSLWHPHAPVQTPCHTQRHTEMRSQMDILEFAQKTRLKHGFKGDGEPVIPGRYGELYEYSEHIFAALCMFPTSRRWGHIRRKAQALVLRIIQNGDSEGTFLFDPTDEEQVEFARRAIGARKRHRISQASIDALIAAGSPHRFSTARR